MSEKKLSGIKAHTRYYTKDGRQVPGTTTVLGVLNKPHLIKWANDLGLQGIDVNKYRDKLATVGTIAHYLVECHIKGEKPNLSAFSPQEIDLAENSFLSFLEWEKQYNIQYLHSEIPLVSETYLYGGTIDCYAILNGKNTILDFKTSKAIYPEMIIQLAAYKQLAEENGYPVEEVRILRIGRTDDEGFEERRESNLSNHWELFKHLRKVYEYQKIISRNAAV